ncbi:hypothetical protein SAMN04488541_103057, partial [Thermoflexibacter ruber]
MFNINKYSIFENCTIAECNSKNTMYLILNTTKLIEIYITCDDFAKKFEQYQLSQGQVVPQEKMSCSEIMAIVIYYHISGMKCFKYYYQSIIKGYL